MEQAAELREPPYGFSAEFPAGVYELTAVAEDWAGNLGESEVVRIAIGMELPPEPEGSTGAMSESSGGGDTSAGEAGTGGGESSGGSDGGEDTSAAEDDGSSGCGCRSQDPGSAGWLMFGVIALLRRRR
jgi:MYXO-CTERM domain-containing protein